MPQQPNSDNRRKWNLIIDVAKSVHANNAALVAKDEYVGNAHESYSAPLPEEGAELFNVDRKVRGVAPIVDVAYLLRTCNHCDNAPCKEVGGDAVTKREDGIVIIDPKKAKGRKDIFEACPYGAVIWNEELELPQNWIFDAHLLDAGWRVPRCVDVTPLEAIEAIQITDEEMQSRAEAESLEVLKPELGTRPRVYYRNLYRFTKCFIAGTLVAKINGREDCVQDAAIELRWKGGTLENVKTDAFGEFKFDRLQPGSGEYEIIASHANHGSVLAQCELRDESLNLGVIAFNPD